ncbi:hypothetical protein Q5X75_10705 [Acinetobacter baumannii]|uniref:hypothetical protein n=1 Tax=Acinetobacter baumannii TaxID=470 RepID=UPI000810C66E|nr:hypothetical protein [Acinetobacter baumannii]MDC5012941.1 hypothetical protein [Acinetobacter baumannii]MDN8574999.1 hypothetical protein [Acinetobacter baumannii]MDO7507882.1 hypothetical protein [Acinetobacter baumannii]WFF52422.1 hypothetical protein OSV61_11280 [Acinetobacter baumannii]
MSFTKVSLEGDFLEAFLYSGILFTVDTDGILSTCSFKNLINSYLNKTDHEDSKTIKKYILNDEKVQQSYDGENIILYIDKEFINENCIFENVPLEVWPTDLDIKSNNIYISSERGLDILPFNWEMNSVSFSKEEKKIKNIWDDTKVFSLATGSWGRTILAAGSEGAIEIFNTYDNYYRNIIDSLYEPIKPKSIANGTWLDCDWGNSKVLVLKNFDEQKTFLFDNTAKPNVLEDIKKEDEEKFERSVDDLMDDLVKNPKNIEINKKNILEYSISNGKIIGIDNKGNKYQFNLSKNEWKLTSTVKYESSLNEYSGIKFIYPGTIIESNEKLYIDKSNELYKLDDDFIKWRTFPRSKNYVNHTLIIKDNELDIYAL